MSTFRVQGPLSVTGATALSSTLNAGASTLASAAITGAATVGTTLGVSGATTLSSTLNAGASTLASAAITGAATVGTTLGVSGATTLSSTLNAGASTLASAAVTGAATVGSTLGVTGAATFASTVNVTGLLTAGSVDFGALSVDNLVIGAGSSVPGSADTVVYTELHPAAVTASVAAIPVDIGTFSAVATNASGMTHVTINATVYDGDDNNAASCSASAEFDIGITKLDTTWDVEISAGYGFVATTAGITNITLAFNSGTQVLSATVTVGAVSGTDPQLKVWGSVMLVNNFASGIILATA